MTKKIAINGFGRIGRLTAKVLLEKYPEVEIVAVNDLTSSENLAYLFKHDTAYGIYPGQVSFTENELIINDRKIRVLAEKNPADLPWKELEVDLVLECTGFFTTSETARLHLQAGAKKVILSAPAKSPEIPTVVLGVNYPKPEATIISNASCTTNCITPAFKVILDNFDLEYASGITVHAYTASQPIQDGPSKKAFRDGRAGAANMVPSSTGAAKAAILALPELAGKMEITSLRVPVLTGSMVFFSLTFKNSITKDELNLAMKTAVETNLQGILEYSEAELVSSDVVGNSHSCIFDSKLTEASGNKAKITLWYDNEMGYSNRLASLTASL